jgi:hypothetical protein
MTWEELKTLKTGLTEDASGFRSQKSTLKSSKIRRFSTK